MNGQWQKIHFWVKPPKHIQQLAFAVDLNIEGNTGASFNFDDFSVVDLSENRPSQVTNGGLEQNTAESALKPIDWGTGALGGAQAQFSLDTTQPRSGKNALLVNILELANFIGASFIYTGPDSILVKPNTPYRLSGWVKGTAGAKIHASAIEPYTWKQIAQKDVTVSNDWQEIHFEILTPDDASLLGFGIDLNIEGNKGAKLYFDDFDIQEVF